MDLRPYYRPLNKTLPNFSPIEKQVWKNALFGKSKVELISDEDVKMVKQQLKSLGLVKIKIQERLVKAEFPPIQDLNSANPLFKAYIQGLKMAISRAEHLNPIQKACCKVLDEIWNQIQSTNNKYVTVPYDFKIWESVRTELLKTQKLKFRVFALGKEQWILVWNWSGENPRLRKEDLPESFHLIFGERRYLE